MKPLKALICAFIAFVFAISAAGCKKDEAAPVIPDEAGSSAVLVAEPQKAVDQIYASLTEYKANPVTEWQIEELLGINREDLIEFYGKISNPTGGLSDVLILLPQSEKRDEVQLALSKYKEKRMAEFEDYDILDAYPISQNAAIYDQGDYIIMLMLADNDSARVIVDQYIPL